MPVWGIVLLTCAAAAAGLGIGLVGWIRSGGRTDNRQPLRQVHAMISDKEIEECCYDQTGPSFCWYVIFQADGGGRIRLQVSKPQYAELDRGLPGTLRYRTRGRQELFVSFAPDPGARRL